MKPVPPSVSHTQMTEIVLPSHANNLGTIFGGVVMQWIDMCAAMASIRHCRRNVVTASVDDLTFLTPIHPGDFVILTAQVNAAFRTSMEVGVQVDAEVPLTGERRRCLDAFLTFVAIDAHGKAVPVPPLDPQTDAERRRAQEAARRREERLRRRVRSA